MSVVSRSKVAVLSLAFIALPLSSRSQTAQRTPTAGSSTALSQGTHPVGTPATQVATPTAAPSPVIQMLRSSRDSRVRMQAAVTLGRMRPPGAREALEHALHDSDPTVRAMSAESLRVLNDVAAVTALRAARTDLDSAVRASVERALRVLDRNTPVAVSPAAGTATVTTVVNGRSVVDWTRARFVLRAGSLANRADQRGQVVDSLRTALAQEVARLEDVAFVPGALPAEAETRVRSGRLRVYEMDGAVQQLRRWTVASTVNVRAEVSLVLVSMPARDIIGSMSGAATAANTTAPGVSADSVTRDLEARALAGAVRGAVANLRTSLQGRH